MRSIKNYRRMILNGSLSFMLILMMIPFSNLTMQTWNNSPTMPEASNYGVIYQQDFNNEVIGENPIGWSISENENAYNVIDIADGIEPNSKCIVMTDNQVSSSVLGYKEISATSEGFFTFDVKCIVGSYTTHPYKLILSDSSNNPIFIIEISNKDPSDGFFKLKIQSQTIDTYPTYTILSVRLEFSNSVFNLDVNNTRYISNHPYNNLPISYIRIESTNLGGGGNVYFDNFYLEGVAIYVPPVVLNYSLTDSWFYQAIIQTVDVGSGGFPGELYRNFHCKAKMSSFSLGKVGYIGFMNSYGSMGFQFALKDSQLFYADPNGNLLTSISSVTANQWVSIDMFIAYSYGGLNYFYLLVNGVYKGRYLFYSDVEDFTTIRLATGILPSGYTFSLAEILFTKSDSTYVTNDWDNDELFVKSEIETYHTRPDLDDTDADQLKDNIEVTIGTNPTRSDSDGDELSDYDEYYGTFGYMTNPLKIDTDGDQLNDKYEILGSISSTPNSSTVSGDFITNPTLYDTDNDGMNDGWETMYYSYNYKDIIINPLTIITYEFYLFAPTVREDELALASSHFDLGYKIPELWNHFQFFSFDGDGLTNAQESQVFTNPYNSDTDGDELNDGWEYVWNTNPLINDRDEDYDYDFLTNYEEFKVESNPWVHNENWDYDGDNITNLVEKNLYHTCMWNDDTDGDGYSDYDEINVYLTSPLVFTQFSFNYGGFNRDTDVIGSSPNYWVDSSTIPAEISYNSYLNGKSLKLTQKTEPFNTGSIYLGCSI